MLSPSLIFRGPVFAKNGFLCKSVNLLNFKCEHDKL